MSATEREYVLGTHDAELARLGFQHQVWAEPTAAAWERAGFAPGHHLLDVGCGPGYASFDLARLVGPAGRVQAVDVSERFVRHLDEQRRRRGVETIEPRVADLQEVELEPASVDGAFARWVLCFVPHPERVVARVARALRPGAAFAVMDYCNYEAFTMAPAADVVDVVLRAVGRSFRQAGGNPHVGRELPRLMQEAGLEVREVRPLVRLARPGSALWEWPRTFFANYLPGLVARGELAPRDAEAFAEVYAERTASPGSFLLTPPMVEVVGVRPR